MSINLQTLFSQASRVAEAYDGSEASYEHFFKLAIAFDSAANDNARTSQLLDQAITALGKKGDFLETLKQGGAQIFHHGAVFIRPDPECGIVPGDGASKFEEAAHEPRLKEVILALQGRGIFFDDLIIDIGGLRPGQMRKYPYAIITILRLDAQIAVADQKNEVIFVARPALEFMNWALFTKPQAGQKGTPFENVQRVVHAGGWESKLLDILFPDEKKPAPSKIDLKTYVSEKRKSKYPLTENMVVAMAKIYRDQHPQKQWPTEDSGPIPHEIIVAATGDPNWQDENWGAIDVVGRQKLRGLTRSLPQILKARDCAYDLTEDMVVKMARMVRDQHPQKQWPSKNSGNIPREIIVAVTGDPNWQDETWEVINSAGKKKNRSLTRSLPKILDAHCSERGAMPHPQTEPTPAPA